MPTEVLLKRRALFVLGMHRSGTAALARVLSLRGATLPRHLLAANQGNPAGYWEPERIVALNERILASFGLAWDDPYAPMQLDGIQAFPAHFAEEARRIVSREYGDAPLFVLKDPRCTLLEGFWREVLASLGIAVSPIVMVRPYQEVVASLARRDGSSSVGAALLYAAYGLASANHGNARHTYVLYQDFIDDWRAVTDRIAIEQGFQWPASVPDPSAEIDHYLLRGASKAAPCPLPHNVREWAEAVWEWQLAATQGRPQAPEALLPVRARMADELELFAPLLVDKNHRLAGLERARDTTQSQAEALACERDIVRSERDEALRLYRDTDALLQQANAHHQALQQQQEATLAERDEVLRIYRDTDALLQQANVDYRNLDNIRLDLQVTLAAARTDLTRTQQQLSSMLGSRSWRMTAPLRKAAGTSRRLLGREPSSQPPPIQAPLTASMPHASSDAGEVVLADVPTTDATEALIARDHPELRSFLVAEFGDAIADDVVLRIDRYRLPIDTQEVRQSVRIECTPGQASAWIAQTGAFAQSRCAPDEAPDVSIIIPVYNQLPFTLACIDALLSHRTRYTFEILVGDDASTDATDVALAQPIAGVRHIRHADNLGFVRNCNTTAAHARGRHVLFLNNDTQVLPGWLDELIGTLDANPDIGLAGSKLVFPDGRLQECGAIVWRDGSAWNYGRLADPRRPEFCYLRDVDYVSGASIALRRELWQALGGFDEMFVPAYAEDADLAFRVRALGLRTVVQPLSQLLHFEGISSGTDTNTGAKACQVENLRKLHARWHGVLATHRVNADSPELEKERSITRRVLFVDHCTPTPKEDAGSVVAFEVMRGFMANGYKVTFIPEDNFAHMGADTHGLQRLGIEAIYHPAYSRMPAFLSARGDPFDVIFLHRFGVGDAHMAALRKKYPMAKVIFLNADMHHLREMREAEITGDAIIRARALHTRERELKVIGQADVALVHSEFEYDLLKCVLPQTQVELFPLIHDPVDTATPLSGRSDVCFVGGFRHPPNADGIAWFVEEAWPLVLARQPEAKLHIVGSHMTPQVQALARHRGVEVVGFVDDLDAFLARRRVSVAPLRYGAGAKGKVAASLAQGLPVACTSVAAEGMQLTPDENVLVGDSPQALARHVVTLLGDTAAWERLSANGLEYARALTSRASAHERLRRILEQ